ncbi:hypothetical protein FRC12_008392 [Ceratobasidium sp. 428]|nr:hypothetical protein FRC12_008392 [Ceratobasidium sp. 428]
MIKSDNDTAGFDPIFFLHHCNVDRILSFWEHIYPDYTAGTKGYLDVDGITRVPFTQANGTFIETSTQTVDSNTPLMPFRKSDYTYWNSDDTHSLHLFDPDKDPEQAVRNKYYTYLPIAGVDLNPKVPPTPEQRDQQRAKLQAYFEYNPKKAADSSKVEMPTFDRKDPIYRTIPLGLEIPEKAVPVKNFRQFAVVVSLSPDYCKGRSYSVNVGMDVKGNIKTVGTVTVLGRGTIANCGNCQARRAAKTRVRGVVYVPSDVVDDILVAAPITRSLSSQAAAQDSPHLLSVTSQKLGC